MEDWELLRPTWTEPEVIAEWQTTTDVVSFALFVALNVSGFIMIYCSI